MKTRLALISIFVFLLVNGSYSQDKHEIGVNFGISSGGLSYTILKEGFLMGAGTSYIENSKTIGIRYFRQSSTKENIWLETGINYLNATLVIKPAPIGDPIILRKENYNLVSIPVYINCSFWKYFYVNGGIILDYQNSESGNYDAFGAGYGFGLGGKYSFEKVKLYVNPKFERHLFYNEKDGLFELGIMFGITYSI